MSLKCRIRTNIKDFTLDVNLHTPSQGVTAIFGPSGSGKTSILRAIAGLENYAGAEISCNGVTWQSTNAFTSTHQRSVGFVFQQPSLFLHLNVRENIEFAIKRAKGKGVDIDELIAMLGIDSLLERCCSTLSGGEAQRVAIVRALATNPHVLLMDEPLSALDQGLKDELLPYLERMHRELAIPILYVSHSREEVARISDYLVLLENGSVVAEGETLEMFTLLDSPLSRNEYTQTIIEARQLDTDSQDPFLNKVDSQLGELWLATSGQLCDKQMRIRILAKDVSICVTKPEKTSVLNILPATILDFSESGKGQVTVQLSVNGHTLLSRITAKSMLELDVKKNMRVYAQVKGVALVT